MYAFGMAGIPIIELAAACQHAERADGESFRSGKGRDQTGFRQTSSISFTPGIGTYSKPQPKKLLEPFNVMSAYPPSFAYFSRSVFWLECRISSLFLRGWSFVRLLLLLCIFHCFVSLLDNTFWQLVCCLKNLRRLVVLFFFPQLPVAPIYTIVCIFVYKIVEVSNQMHAKRWCMLESIL